MTIHDGSLLWGKRVIVPRKLHSKLLEELHMGHISICRIKTLTRSFIWWPGLDKAIGKEAAQCEPYKVTVAMPKAVSRHPWQLPNGPWERVHVDYGEWNNHYFFCWLMLLANGLKSRQSLPQHPRQLLTSCEIFFQHAIFHRWWFPIMAPN